MGVPARFCFAVGLSAHSPRPALQSSHACGLSATIPNAKAFIVTISLKLLCAMNNFMGNIFFYGIEKKRIICKIYFFFSKVYICFDYFLFLPPNSRNMINKISDGKALVDLYNNSNIELITLLPSNQFSWTETAIRLKFIRVTNNLSQAQFADSLGVFRNVILNIESGKRKLSVDILVKLVEVYSIDLHWLLFGEKLSR